MPEEIGISDAEVLLLEFRHLYDEITDTWETYDNGVETLISRVYDKVGGVGKKRTPEQMKSATASALKAASVSRVDPISFTDFVAVATSQELELPAETSMVSYGPQSRHTLFTLLFPPP